MEVEEIQNVELEIVEFRLGHESYGFESRFVREVYPLKDLCPLPCTPAFVLGLINLRGQLLSVLDLREFFAFKSQESATQEGTNPKHSTQEAGNHSQTLILQHGAMEIGILVDSLLGVRHLPRHAIQMAAPAITGLRREFLIGMTTAGLFVLDAEKLLTSRHIIIHETVHESVYESGIEPDFESVFAEF